MISEQNEKWIDKADAERLRDLLRSACYVISRGESAQELHDALFQELRGRGESLYSEIIPYYNFPPCGQPSDSDAPDAKKTGLYANDSDDLLTEHIKMWEARKRDGHFTPQQCEEKILEIKTEQAARMVAP